MVNDTKVIKFGEIGTSLGTRNLGAKIRQDILSGLEKSDKVIFDFNGVEVVTNSFADECFGKLRQQISTDVFMAKLSFINVNDFIQRVLISAF